MRSMLSHSFSVHTNAFDTDVSLSRYVDGWGRPGDTALVAIEGGHRVGVGWYRLFRRSAPGHGFVDDQTPELIVGVVPSRRSGGIAQLLLGELLERARLDAYRSVSVSLERDQPDVDLYAATGFDQVAASPLAVTLQYVFS
jgi:GNAT superfamily N-acetyltransferase